MTEQALTVAQYGDREIIKELGKRVRRFLPNGDKMTDRDALGLAQLAIAQDLNPFSGEIWFVPKVGIVTGIEGYRKMARRKGSFTARCRMMTGAEREAHNVEQGDYGSICELYRPDQMMDVVRLNREAGRIVIPVEPVIGVGIKRMNEKNTYPLTGRSFQWVADKRAEADALRKAFDFEISYADNGHTRAAEPEVTTLPEWAVEVLDDEPMTKDEAAATLERNRELLHGSDGPDWDAPLADMGEPGAAQQADDVPHTADEPIDAAESEFPDDWREFSALALKKLPYTQREQLVAKLKEAGIWPLSDNNHKCLFNLADGWAILAGA